MLIKRKPRMHYQRAAASIEHSGFYAYLLRYVEAMQIRNYAESTLYRRENDLRRFIAWCDARSLETPQAITKPILESYQKYLYYYRQANGEALSPTSRNHYITSVKQFFKWLSQENYLLYNPASELVVPRLTPSLPVVLTVEEIEQLLQQPDVNTPYGVRDRAILEVFYSTGIRRSELCCLCVADISVSRQTLYVKNGKGGKDRLLPLGASASHWLHRYLLEVRQQLLVDINQSALFLNDYGEPFRDNKLGDRVKRFMKNARISAPGSCHLLRHAMATHMLENGAELRYIQAMLGHSDYRATQIYTHVSIRKLQAVHALTHPAKMKPPSGTLVSETPVSETSPHES